MSAWDENVARAVAQNRANAGLPPQDEHWATPDGTCISATCPDAPHQLVGADFDPGLWANEPTTDPLGEPTMPAKQSDPLVRALHRIEVMYRLDPGDVDLATLKEMQHAGLMLVKACQAVMDCPTDEYSHSEAERAARDRGVVAAQDWLRAVVDAGEAPAVLAGGS